METRSVKVVSLPASKRADNLEVVESESHVATADVGRTSLSPLYCHPRSLPLGAMAILDS